jgi:DNA polymerase-4
MDSLWTLSGEGALGEAAGGLGWIIHIDMDAFFAAVEQHDRPELRGKPVIVGGSAASRGVVSTASYEARRFGVRSAMSTREALRLCPHGVFLPVRGSRYIEVSRRIMAVLRAGANRVEAMSIDEAYIDPGEADPVTVARNVKERIYQETGLTASVGVGPNKFLAKLASDLDKPGGFVVIAPEDVDRVLPPLPVRALPGIGPKSASDLASLGIHTVAELRAADRALLKLHLGRRSEELLRLAYGQDDRGLEIEHETKSLAAETTFAVDIGDREVLREQLRQFAEELAERMASAGGLRARTVTVKARFRDFQTVSRSQTVERPLGTAQELTPVAEELLSRIERRDLIRLIGLQVSGFDEREPRAEQLRFDFGSGQGEVQGQP